jgi:hypothetical protein
MEADARQGGVVTAEELRVNVIRDQVSTGKYRVATKECLVHEIKDLMHE